MQVKPPANVCCFNEFPYLKNIFFFQLPVWAHGTIELLALTVIGVELHLKLKWIGWGTILKHKRTMLKVNNFYRSVPGLSHMKRTQN